MAFLLGWDHACLLVIESFGTTRHRAREEPRRDDRVSCNVFTAT
jgi:hypothetical protein